MIVEHREQVPRLLAAAYLVLLPIAWPTLPGNGRVIDLLILVLAAFLIKDIGRLASSGLTALDWSVAAYLVAPLPSLAVSDDLRASTIVFAKHLYLAAVFVVFAAYFRRYGVRPSLRVIAWAAVSLCAVSIAFVGLHAITGVEVPPIGQPMTLPYVGSVLRLLGFTESPEMFGNYLTFAFPLLMVEAADARGVSRWVGAAALEIAAMILTFSHALAGFVTAAVQAGWRTIGGRWRVARPMAIAMTAVLVLGINLLLIVSVRDLTWARDRNPAVPPAAFEYAFQPPEGADRLTLSVSFNPMSYWLLKRIAFDAFRSQPLTGVGLGRFHVVTERAFAEGRIHERYRAIDPHSTVLGALAETGVPGGITVVVLLAVAVWTGMSSRADPSHIWIARAVTAAIVGLMINSLNTDIMHFRFLWVGLAALRADT